MIRRLRIGRRRRRTQHGRQPGFYRRHWSWLRESSIRQEGPATLLGETSTLPRIVRGDRDRVPANRRHCAHRGQCDHKEGCTRGRRRQSSCRSRTYRTGGSTQDAATVTPGQPRTAPKKTIRDGRLRNASSKAQTGERYPAVRDSIAQPFDQRSAKKNANAPAASPVSVASPHQLAPVRDRSMRCSRSMARRRPSLHRQGRMPLRATPSTSQPNEPRN